MRQQEIDIYLGKSDSNFNTESNTSYFREFSQNRIEDFFSKGFKKRHFFPHKAYYLLKSGPDGYKIASWIFKEVNPSKIFEIIIYAISPVIDEFPDSIFFDDELLWHQEQFGKKGQIASVTLLVEDKKLYTFVHLSDIYQRISRNREFKTRIENRFKGWSVLLINSILNFAVENHLEDIFTPTSELALTYTDRQRNPKKELFERIYDLSVNRYYKAEKSGNWWKINVNENRERLVVPEIKNEYINRGKTICVAHDIEAGLGHVGQDSELVEFADKNHESYLKQMLQIEDNSKIPATYNVVGCLFDNIVKQISSFHQCISFHSYNHKMEEEQLDRCRKIDYRIKGYRVPQSIMTTELTAKNLLFHNFEWIASQADSIKTMQPKLEAGIINIPVIFDDYFLYKHKMTYEEWENKSLQIIDENDFVAFCLHDCYGSFWLSHYESFLSKIKHRGTFKTFNQVADEMFLANAIGK